MVRYSERRQGSIRQKLRKSLYDWQEILEVVTLLLPEQEALELPLRNAEFTWKIDQEPENAQYRFTLSRDENGRDSDQRTVKEKALKVNQEFQSNSRYYWSVDLLIGEEVRTGEVRTFKTFNNPPGVPTARSPVNGNTDVSTRSSLLSRMPAIVTVL